MGECDIGDWTSIVNITAGWMHTAGAKSDGTALAVGYGDYGQCNVGGWTNTVQVASGDYHTVGLRSNGTVVAAGPETTLATWDLF
jgi:alpha-tubulin suppressor-like RCC1 family protein